MSGGFKRSGVFGIVGVFVVAALAIVIATTMGAGQANPKLALGLIFGVIALFCLLLFALQRSDLTRAAGSDGGEISKSYERTDRAMKPLGLQVSERPQGGFEMRMPTTPGFDYRLRGWTVLAGERHGRQVAVRLGGHEDAGATEVIVVEPCADFAASGKRLSIEAGPEGILITRRKGEQRDWLCDLWLAERLAATT